MMKEQTTFPDMTQLSKKLFNDNNMITKLKGEISRAKAK